MFAASSWIITKSFPIRAGTIAHPGFITCLSTSPTTWRPIIRQIYNGTGTDWYSPTNTIVNQPNPPGTPWVYLDYLQLGDYTVIDTSSGRRLIVSDETLVALNDSGSPNYTDSASLAAGNTLFTMRPTNWATVTKPGHQVYYCLGMLLAEQTPFLTAGYNNKPLALTFNKLNAVDLAALAAFKVVVPSWKDFLLPIYNGKTLASTSFRTCTTSDGKFELVIFNTSTTNGQILLSSNTGTIQFRSTQYLPLNMDDVQARSLLAGFFDRCATRSVDTLTVPADKYPLTLLQSISWYLDKYGIHATISSDLDALADMPANWDTCWSMEIANGELNQLRSMIPMKNTSINGTVTTTTRVYPTITTITRDGSLALGNLDFCAINAATTKNVSIEGLMVRNTKV